MFSLNQKDIVLEENKTTTILFVHQAIDCYTAAII